MIGVIVAAGKGTRMGSKCKALEMYKGNRLIQYPLANMSQADMQEVIIIHNGPYLPTILGEEYLGMKLTYVEQKERKGIAHAISLVESLSKGEDMFVILGDCVIDNIAGFPYGIPSYSAVYFKKGWPEDISESFTYQDGKFVEKPSEPMTNMLGMGVYRFTYKIFEAIRKTPKGKNGEIQITDALNYLHCNQYLVDCNYKNVNYRSELE